MGRFTAALLMTVGMRYGHSVFLRRMQVRAISVHEQQQHLRSPHHDEEVNKNSKRGRSMITRGGSGSALAASRALHDTTLPVCLPGQHAAACSNAQVVALVEYEVC